MLDPQIAACRGERFGSVASAIVGHHALDGDTHAAVPRNGGPEMGDRADGLLIDMDLAEREP